MALFRKKSDPLSERARALEAEIAALQAQIKQAESGTPTGPGTPKLRSTTWPGGPKTPPAPAAPVFEDVDQQRLKAAPAVVPPPVLTDISPRPQGVSSTMQTLKRHLGLTPSGNPKLVKLLNSGQIQGLRPLRHERRVARNRFFLLSALLLAVLYGLFKAILGGR